MRALILTNEFPPSVYGGAGVHVAELTRHLRDLAELEIRTFGDHDIVEPGFRVQGYGAPAGIQPPDERLRPAIDAVGRAVAMAAAGTDADVVHCHTWYTHLAGVLTRLAHGIPLVVTVHSLEPLRPWKREQLGGGYEISTWVERTALECADAVVAVSSETRRDVLRLFDLDPQRVQVIPNGIDADFYRPDDGTDALARLGIDAGVPYVLFLGRVARQKGIAHFLRALEHLDPSLGVVLCAGQADTPELGAEVEAAVSAARRTRSNIVWIDRMVSREDARQLYSHATVFCCPSVYEPFGLINLEAAACETPVVASAVGGIPEVVADGVTGVLVPVELREDDPMVPRDAAQFERDLASAINRLADDAALRARMGAAGRRRAVDEFSWRSVARETAALYEAVAG